MNPTRCAGVLLHPTSLPGQGPVGNLGPQARLFVDFLKEARQGLWQVLPLTPPARGNSPYSSYSVFAGNPLLISPEDLEEEGLLPAGSCSALYKKGPFSPTQTDYAAARRLLIPLLRTSYRLHRSALAPQLSAFREKEGGWLEDYALFVALRAEYRGIGFRRWPEPLLHREPQALREAAARVEEEAGFQRFLQYLFFRQWSALRRYANSRGVSILGDVPIYADRESADVWANPGVFQLDGRLESTAVSGVPPDAFSKTGQLWGNPLYDWDALRQNGYDWWLRRLAHADEMYDMVRIDHFRGLESYWSVPKGARTAKTGCWRKGPGMDFLGAVARALPQCRMVAEDLGLIGDDVRALLEESGHPGLAVLQFAFEPGSDSLYLPHHMKKNQVAYIGTHDNDTAMGWLSSAPPEESALAREYMHLTPQEGEHWGMIRTLYASVADTAVILAQDLLGLGSEARFNIPAQKEGNWAWRLAPGALGPEISRRMARMAQIYGRCPQTQNNT